MSGSSPTFDEGQPTQRKDGAPVDLEAMSAWDYALPEELIAATPMPERSDARLLVSADGNRVDTHVRALPDFLQAGDLLVFNDTRVVPARVHARRSSGGRVEVLAVGTSEEGRWEPCGSRFVAMLRSNKRLRDGEIIEEERTGDALRFLRRREDGLAELELAGTSPASHSDESARLGAVAAGDLFAWLQRVGEMPLPPYIVQRRAQLDGPAAVDDSQRYQTLVAQDYGAVAAPTAGLHFDETLLRTLAAKGVERTTVTLNVGIGTFRPVRTERLSEHEMHSEVYRVGSESAAAILRAKQQGRRVIAVGTTVVRTLEAWARSPLFPEPVSEATALFIRPGFDFELIDALVTNFHLPRSTLLALVAAFHGYERVRELYEHAVAERYRFFSYGDAMLLGRQAAAGELPVAAGATKEVP